MVKLTEADAALFHQRDLLLGNGDLAFPGLLEPL